MYNVVVCSVHSVPHHYLFLKFIYVCSSPQHWSNIITHSVEWPLERSSHAATHLSGSLFVIVGGEDKSGYALNDMWLCDTTTKLWKKVLFLVTVLCVHKQLIIFYNSYCNVCKLENVFKF